LESTALPFHFIQLNTSNKDSGGQIASSATTANSAFTEHFYIKNPNTYLKHHKTKLYSCFKTA
jgi:hypothetical protein